DTFSYVGIRRYTRSSRDCSYDVSSSNLRLPPPSAHGAKDELPRPLTSSSADDREPPNGPAPSRSAPERRRHPIAKPRAATPRAQIGRTVSWDRFLGGLEVRAYYPRASYC